MEWQHYTMQQAVDAESVLIPALVAYCWWLARKHGVSLWKAFRGDFVRRTRDHVS